MRQAIPTRVKQPQAGLLQAGLGCLLATLLLAGTPTLAQDVGVAAAVNPATLGTPPGQTTRVVQLGGKITFLEEIETDDGGQTQVLFIDQSTLTIAPNSFVVVDEFVFDPASVDGDLTLTLERGLVRYVGGAISKDGGVTIETEVATVGIRGGMAILDNRTPRRLEVINLFGQTTIKPKGSGGEVVILDDASEQAVIEPSGLRDLGRVSSSDLRNIKKSFRGGNRTRIITAQVQQQLAANPDADASADPVSVVSQTPAGDPPAAQQILADTQNDLGSEVARGLQQEQISNTEPEQPEDLTDLSGSYNATPNAYTTPTGGAFTQPLVQNAKGGPDPDFARRFTSATIVNNDQLQIDSDGDGVIDLVLPIADGEFTVPLTETSSPLGALSGTGSFTSFDASGAFFSYDLQTASGTRRVQVVGGLPTDPSVFEQGNLEVFAYDLDLSLSTAFPDIQATQLLVATAPGGGFDSLGGNYRSSVLWMAFSVEGEGENQRSILQATAGKLTDLGNGKPVLVQTARGSVLDTGSQVADITRTVTTVGSLVDGDGNAFFGPDADRIVISNNGPFPLEGSTSEQQARSIGQIFIQPYDDLGGTSLGYSDVAPRTETPDGVGDQRPSTTLVGYASGVGASRLPGNQFSEIYVLDSNTAEGGPGLVLQRDAASSSLSASADFEASSFVTNGNAPTSARWVFGDFGSDNAAYLDEDHFAALESFQNNRQGYDGEVNRNDEGADGRNRYGFRSFIVGQEPLNVAGFFPETQFCTCAYLQWGLWSGEYQWDPSGDQAGRRERVHIGAWVAGERPSAADIAGLSGTATHNGHVFGTVALANGSQRLASGQYKQTFNFGTDTGTFAIHSFDGRDYTGGNLGSAGTGHQADFKSTSAATAANGFKANVRASFYKGGGDAAKQVGGTFKITDGGRGRYTATGIVAADRQ